MKHLLCSALSLFLLVSANVAQAQAPISVSPNTVKAGTSPTLTISSNGFFDLTGVTAAQIEISPQAGVSNKRVSNASARSLTLSFDLAGTAAGGPRSLIITAHDVSVSMKLTVEREARPPGTCRPACRPPRECVEGRCVRPPQERVCRPPCRPPRVCESGRCILVQ